MRLSDYLLKPACLPVLFLCGSALAAQQLPLANLPVFHGRELTGVPSLAAAAKLSGKIDVAIYNQIDPEKSLLIHNCAGWCNAPELSFATIFSKALAVTSPQADSAAAAASWFKSATILIPAFPNVVAPKWPSGKLESAPFQVLAVVNRMDLAQWDEATKCWKGAEIRVVYGSTIPYTDGGPGHFTLIIEFVLKPLPATQFRAMAQDWLALSSLAEPDLGQQLIVVTHKTLQDQSISARIRTNSGMSGAWALAQWQFSPQMAPAKLDAQIKTECVNSQTNCRDYLKIWEKFASSDPKPLLWPIGPDLEPDLPAPFLYPLIAVAGPRVGQTVFLGMPTPKGLKSPDPAARDVLSLQQCSFCHSSETATENRMHVANRLPNNPIATLSPFLRGVSPGQASVRPTIDQLTRNDEKFVSVAYVQYNNIDSSGKMTPAPIERRKFHDLGRRMLFMAAILSEPETAVNVLNDPSYTPLAIRFATRLTH